MLLFLLSLLSVAYLVFVLQRRFLTVEKIWLPPLNYILKPASLVFTCEDLRRVWKWEVEAGHYPSGHSRT